MVYLQDGNYCMSASRDRSICLWNTTLPVVPVINPVVHKANSHTGWIWDLEMYDDDHFLSCSWDSKIKLWNIKYFSQDTNPLQTFM